MAEKSAEIWYEKYFEKSLAMLSGTATIKPNLINQTSRITNRKFRMTNELMRQEPRSQNMARPRAKELTERELEVMQVFWKDGEMTAVDARERLAANGLDRAYTTIATLVRILLEKGFLDQLSGSERPFRYRPTRSQEEVSGRMLADVVTRVFGGSREQLLVQLLKQKKLTAREREVLKGLLAERG
jgi:predicted transcriptional regulator